MGVPIRTKPQSWLSRAQAEFNPRKSKYWSLDGKKIAFSAYRDGNYDIYMMNADGSNPKQLTNNPAEDINPRWIP